MLLATDELNRHSNAQVTRDAHHPLTGVKVATALIRILEQRPKPLAISVDNGTEFLSKAMDAWAYGHEVRLDFIRPGRPVENAFIESFNGRLRDECLNSHVFGSVAEAQAGLAARGERGRSRGDEFSHLAVAA